ncbi:uncharacterized protein LOC123874643 [Maniola jurtina]|uniref:uncharacterized protein LOC123874643 n=1 Tax=Maniola jurtina TaxID=191418 RepID=UPI001E68C2BC|nr:uncharacterized protein LOC123874643 [Maniola jurtina]
MDEDSIVKLVVDTFSYPEISVAKQLLFASINTTVRNISRRKEKEHKDVEDIICAFKNTEPDNTPIFAARDLSKLPPVTFDHIDVTRLLKDVVLMKSDINFIKETYATVQELNHLKNHLNQSLASVDNVNKRRGAYLLDSGPSGILNLSNMSVASSSPMQVNDSQTHDQTNEHRSHSLTQDVSAQCEDGVPFTRCGRSDDKSTSRAGTEKLAFSRNTLRNDSSQQCNTQPVNIDARALADVSPTAHSINLVTGKTVAEVVRSEGEWKQDEPNQEWTEVQRKRYRNRKEGVRGKAAIQVNDKFRPADLKIPLFVSNVHKDTLEKDIVEYIFLKTNENVIIQKIKMKTERGYSAYKIMVTRHKLHIFLNDEIWPDGVTCRRFMPYRNRDLNIDKNRNIPDL